MQKFSLNESLRIYLPGLFLSILLFFIFNSTLEGIEKMLLPAIFVGFLFNTIFGKWHDDYFKKRVLDKNYNEQWKDIAIFKLGSSKMESIAATNKMLDFLEGAFFSKRYTSAELIYFRYPKSMGIMLFNLMIACYVGVGVSLGKLVYFYDDLKVVVIQIFIVVGLSLSAYLFFRGSTYFFDSSLYRELAYWRMINDTEVKEVSEILELWKLQDKSSVKEELSND